jgi:RimJ/RimL family protein N-acetyltransferase
LVQLAAASGLVTQVVAEILPSNIASAKVVSRLGFTDQGSFVDTDGETVTRWMHRIGRKG